MTCRNEPGEERAVEWAALLEGVQQEIADTQAEREAWEEENGEMSEAEEAARLLEAASGRKWSWVRQQENLLRRSIDRKVRLLLDLRRQRDAGAQAQSSNHKFQNPDSGNGKDQTASDGGAEKQRKVRNEPTERPRGTQAGGSDGPFQIPGPETAKTTLWTAKRQMSKK
jgi:hypothetical protein